MENIKELLAKIVELNDFAFNRGEDLLKADGIPYDVSHIEINHYNDSVEIVFEEWTTHYSPYRNGYGLSLEDLEMDEIEWAEKIEHLTNVRLEKEQREKDRIEKQKLAAKQKQFEELKKELGQ